MTEPWIDFTALRQQADFTTVLEHYDVKLTGRGEQRSGLCPFHDEKKPSFKAHLGKGSFHCFGCGAKGNLLDFVQRMEGGSLRQAAETLAAICGLDLPERDMPARAAQKPVERRRKKTTHELSSSRKPRNGPPVASDGPSADKPGAEPASDDASDDGLINPPLTFALKLEPAPEYLEARNIGPELARAFGLGLCARGLMKGRLCIPIHDEWGELVAYAGRFVGDDPTDGKRYLLPPKFRKSHVLFNLDRVLGEQHLVLVEGYFGVIRLHALGIPAVALMGTDLADEQLALLEASGARLLTLLFDGDAAGRTAAKTALPRLARAGFFVRLVELPDGEQPDTVDEASLATLHDAS